MIRFSYLSDSFIGVAFPVRFLGFMSFELDYQSKICVCDLFCSLSMDFLCFLQAQSPVRVSNLPYSASLSTELDYFESLDRSSKNFTCPYSIYGRLGIISFGFYNFGFYVATNLRGIIGAVSRKKIIDLRSFALYQLESLKDPPDCNNYPITYKRDYFDGRDIVVEGIHYSFESLRADRFWTSQVFIGIGFRNPKDIMIHPSHNQFKHWSDVFLSKLGINIYRFM